MVPALIVELLPALGRCLAQVEATAAPRVATAWPMNHGLVGARLLGADGRAQDCIVEARGTRIEAFRPVSPDASPLRGENAPSFLPSREPHPLVGCGRLERVLEPGGSLAGWLHYGC